MRNRSKNRKPRKLSLAIIEITIDEVSRSGAGVGRDKNGRAVFVPFSAPGDRIKVQLTKEKSKYAEGEIIEMLEKSNLRIEPKCAVFSQCGGCQWQHLPYDYQWQVKLTGVKETLRLAKIKYRCLIEEYPAYNTWGYRNRIQLKGNADKIGYFARQSHELVPINTCEVAHPKINSVLDEVRKEGEKQSGEYKVELNLALDHQVNRTWNQIHGAEGFRQINDEQNIKLREWIKARIPKDVSVLDLYGGAGNLTLPVIGSVEETHCVDLTVPDDDFSQQKFYFHRSAVLPWLQQRMAQIKSGQLSIKDRSWFAVIDPPRNGLAKDATQIILCLNEHRVDTVILVGCKPDPWARDVANFVADGWKLKEIALFDFFPQTFHVESVALLIKKKKH